MLRGSNNEFVRSMASSRAEQYLTGRGADLDTEVKLPLNVLFFKGFL